MDLQALMRIAKYYKVGFKFDFHTNTVTLTGCGNDMIFSNACEMRPIDFERRCRIYKINSRKKGNPEQLHF